MTNSTGYTALDHISTAASFGLVLLLVLLPPFLLSCYLIGGRLHSRKKMASERTHVRTPLSTKWRSVSDRVKSLALDAGLQMQDIEWIIDKAREGAAVATTTASGTSWSADGSTMGAPLLSPTLVVTLPLLNNLEASIHGTVTHRLAIRTRLQLRLRLAVSELLSSGAGQLVYGEFAQERIVVMLAPRQIHLIISLPR